MSKIKISLEYEGVFKNYTPENKHLGGAGDYWMPIRALLLKAYKPYIWDHDDFAQIPSDGYRALAEIRSIPFDKGTAFEVIAKFTEIVHMFSRDLAVFSEFEISERDHSYFLSNLDKHNKILATSQRGKITGEYIDHNFKEIMTIHGNKPELWKRHDEDDRHRGGGLHITISPVNPQKAGKLVRCLHDKLFDPKGFQSKYRQDPIFRYKNYSGVDMIEYMSLGFHYQDHAKRTSTKDLKLEFFDFLKKVTDVVFEVHQKLEAAA